MTHILPVTIRNELSEDAPTIRLLNEVAFGGIVEAGIVDAIRNNCSSALSLVAEVDGHIVGHILFSPATVASADGDVEGMGLAPMAVDPEYQGRGIGSALIETGLERLRRIGCPFVIVLGHPEYYPRSGFRPASEFGLICQWDGVPDEAFMAIILDETRMSGVVGTAKYRDEFDEAM
jgi:putative acetyltransferase